jgi:hypothetical protein
VVDVSIDVPEDTPPPALQLRLRLPSGNRITGVVLDGRPYPESTRVRARSISPAGPER